MKQKLEVLTNKSKSFIKSANKSKISEETIKMWINEFLEIFGCDVKNTNYILQENSFKNKEIKQRFRINLFET